MYYIVMLKPMENHSQVFGTDRQFLRNDLSTVKNVVQQYQRLFEMKKSTGINRMEVYSVGDFFDNRTFRLETTVY